MPFSLPTSPGSTTPPCPSCPHRHEQLGRVWKVAQEGECVHALWKSLDATEAQHETVLLGQLFQWPLFLLESGYEATLVVCGQEAGQELQEIQAESL